MVARTGAEDIRVHARHGGLLSAVFLKVARWFDSGGERARRSEIESFVSEAANIADLEARILQLQRNQPPFPDLRNR